MIPNFIKTIKQILWRRISQSEIRKILAAKKEAAIGFQSSQSGFSSKKVRILTKRHRQLKNWSNSSFLIGGGGEIRTHETLSGRGFRDRPVKPLRYPSSNFILTYFYQKCGLKPHF